MKKIIPILLLVSSAAIAQQLEEMSFIETTHDFGTVKEEDGPIRHEFKFTNNSNQPIKILNVRASCGCTTPGWSKEEIKPGEEGFVMAEYNPRNRPGPFSKSLTVTTTGAKNRHVLFIKGNVTPRKKSTEELFPVVMGKLRVQYKTLNLGRVKNNKTITKEFEIYNGSEEPVTYTGRFESPGHISISFKDPVIPPKQKGVMILSYDATKKNDLGFVRDNLAFYTDEQENAKKEFTIYVSIDQYFPPLTAEERAKAPRIKVDQSIIDFGKVSMGEVIEKDILVSNEGASDLKIMKLSATCRCISLDSSIEEIKSGEEAVIKLIIDTKGIRGTQQKSITIFNNDPIQPAKRVLVKGYIN